MTQYDSVSMKVFGRKRKLQDEKDKEQIDSNEEIATYLTRHKKKRVHEKKVACNTFCKETTLTRKKKKRRKKQEQRNQNSRAYYRGI